MRNIDSVEAKTYETLYYLKKNQRHISFPGTWECMFEDHMQNH